MKKYKVFLKFTCLETYSVTAGSKSDAIEKAKIRLFAQIEDVENVIDVTGSVREEK